MAGMALAALLPGNVGTVDDAQAIGALAVQRPVTAMRIEATDNPEDPLIYVMETPILVGMHRCEVEYGDGHPHRWWRLEIQVGRKETAIQPGHDLVVAAHPYSNGWVQYTSFKSGSKKARPDLGKQAFRSLRELIEWIEDLDYDFWEKGNYLTAGISEPQGAFQPTKALRNIQRQGLFVFGICTDAATREKELLVTPKVRWLLDKTKAGTLRFGPPKALSTPLEITDEMKAEAMNLMWLAIRQALAGPDEESTQWLGRLVTDKVHEIYCSHLYNLYRMLRRERRAFVEVVRVARVYAQKRVQRARAVG